MRYNCRRKEEKMRYKIMVEYDGTNLVGWQKQKEGASVQEFLERAIEGFLHQTTDEYL